MKIILYTTILILSFSLTDNILWTQNVEMAIKSSKITGKPVLIYFGASWCAPCHMVEANVFPKREFIEFTKQYEMVKMYDDFKKKDSLKYKYYEQMRKKYEIEAIPTFVILKNGKTPCKILSGYQNAENLITYIGGCK